MAEWVDWQNIDEHHRYQQVNDEDFCWICGKTMEEHWFPKTDLAMKAAILNQADEIAKKAWGE